MQIVETSIFTRRVQALLTDKEYRQLRNALVTRPDLGKIIQGSGGLRKARWAAGKRGKSGGVRVIYYWYVAGSQILMLLIYAKNEQDDLTPPQLRILRKIVAEEYP